MTKEDFEEKIRNNEFAEWAVVHGNYYGTPLKPVLEKLEQGKDMLFDIDIQGAAQLSLSLPRARFVFVFPPSLTVLRERLENTAYDELRAFYLSCTLNPKLFPQLLKSVLEK